MRTLTPGLSIMLLLLGFGPAGAADIAVAADISADILQEAKVPDGVQAVAVSPDGRWLAYALPPTGKQGLSEIVRVSASAKHSATVRGAIRDLLFTDDGNLLGLQYRAAKKWEGETFLFSWAVGAPKVERVNRVPPTSTDLDRWPGGNGILLSCRDEIRTLLLPELHSGSLFRVPGDNLAVTSLGHSSFVLIGQEQELLLIDLSLPSGRESMEILARQPVPAQVAALADYPDGKRVLVRLTDDRLFRASLDPAGLVAAGSADHIAGLAKASAGPRLPYAPVATPEPATIAVPEVVAEPEPEPQPAAPVAPVEPTPQPEPAPVPVVTEPVPDSIPAPGKPQLSGRISGRVELVREIVILGPDNILAEAARVKPGAQGVWGVDGLAPGRYRIQVDGGGSRVLVVEPRWVTVEVGPGATAVPEIKILRSF